MLRQHRWHSDDDELRLAAGARPIFDVAENIGRSVRTYRRLLPQAEVWSFEPVPEAMNQLRKNFERV